MELKELVQMLASNLVEQPEKVVVTSSEADGAQSLLIRVAEEDKGKIIGKQGKVIKALRIVAGAAASKDGQKVLVDLE